MPFRKLRQLRQRMKKSRFFEAKLALITGGSSGIGLELAKQLVEAGASVILMARSQDRLTAAKESLTPLRTSPQQIVHTIAADVTNPELLGAAIEELVGAYGVPDFLFNCAGVALPGYVEELNLEVFKWTMDIDFHGTVNTTKLLLPHFLARGSGHIINFSSLAGVIGIFGYSAYSGAKFAVRGFTDVIRSELKPKHIKVSIVYPPDTDTPQLAFESQYKPYETRLLAGSDKPIPAELVAKDTLKAVERGRYAIVPGTEAKLLYFLGTRFGNWVYPVLDILLANIAKKKARLDK